MTSSNEINIRQEEYKDDIFSRNKRRYFINLGLGQMAAMRMHKASGLLGEKSNSEHSWSNVTEHCLVEAARADVMSELLKLPQDLSSDLKTAAALHDYFKKNEAEIIARHEYSWEGFELASEISIERMRDAGFSDRVVWLANSVGHGSLSEVEDMLNKTVLSEDELAYLAMHYIDDYTSGSDWVDDEEGVIERRMRKNESNSKYARLNEDGRARLGGRTTFEAMQEFGLLVQERLSVEIANRSGEYIEPTRLPLKIDKIIKKHISQADK